MGNLTLRDAIGNLDRMADHFGAVHDATREALRQAPAGLTAPRGNSASGGLPDHGQNDLFAKVDGHMQQSTADLLRQSMAAVNAANVATSAAEPPATRPADDGVVIDGEARRVENE